MPSAFRSMTAEQLLARAAITERKIDADIRFAEKCRRRAAPLAKLETVDD